MLKATLAWTAWGMSCVATGVALQRGWLLGNIGWVETTEVPLMLLLALLMVWHARRRQSALAHVTRQAELDSLTGLANRPSFNSALSAALDDESSGNTTVLFVDLDDFRDVNDVFGHGAGDDLLREVAARLLTATSPEDLCARLGGDEFAVLLRGTGAEAAADVARRIVQALAATAPVRGGAAHVGASVGIATSTTETDLEQLIHRADVAMYAAKANGKGRIQVFEPGLLQSCSSRAFERQLAAAAGNFELIVHYQPVLSLSNQRCTAVEALVRWRHPERGLLYPDSFIEIAERIGAIRDIGAFVLRQACADAAAWRDAQPSATVPIHVNISALQLDDDDFIDSVTACLSEFGLAPSQLVLEITESVVISSPIAIDRLNTLAAHGVTIAIDDFGTGYSALTTLRSLPAQIVKIDKSFVAGSAENQGDRAVIEASREDGDPDGNANHRRGSGAARTTDVPGNDRRGCSSGLSLPTADLRGEVWHLAWCKPRRPAANPAHQRRRHPFQGATGRLKPMKAHWRSATVGAVSPTRVTQGKPVRIPALTRNRRPPPEAASRNTW
jgi:diguanylate cyclase (GGDEF)-like protein